MSEFIKEQKEHFRRRILVPLRDTYVSESTVLGALDRFWFPGLFRGKVAKSGRSTGVTKIPDSRSIIKIIAYSKARVGSYREEEREQQPI